MNIVQLTPGAGAMYCGNCFRDNALVRELRALGHEVTMLPLYLPMTLDEEDQSAGAPLFFNGVNVYLEQQSAWFRRAPAWMHKLSASRLLLRFAGKRAAKTRASDVADLTLSMLRGEEGNQARELDQLIAWLKTQARPGVISLSNALLVGLARRLRRELHCPVVITLQGEDAFLDAMPEPQRSEAWRLMAERAGDVDCFIAPTRYFGELMAARMKLRPDQLRVVFNGINVEGFTETRTAEQEARNETAPVLGYFARMCRDKGLPLAVDVFLEIRRRGRVEGLKLHVGGGCGPSDEPVVAEQRRKLETAGLGAEASFFPNVTRGEKEMFMRNLTVFSTPALYGEAFGLYVIEAMAAGVPVVQPRHGGFPEIIEATGGGIVTEPTHGALADGIESLLLDRSRARLLGQAGQQTVRQRFSLAHMARQSVEVYQELARRTG